MHLLVWIDIHGLDDLDELEGDLQGDGNKVVVKDEEGYKLPAESRPSSLRLKKWTNYKRNILLSRSSKL